MIITRCHKNFCQWNIALERGEVLLITSIMFTKSIWFLFFFFSSFVLFCYVCLFVCRCQCITCKYLSILCERTIWTSPNNNQMNSEFQWHRRDSFFSFFLLWENINSISNNGLFHIYKSKWSIQTLKQTTTIIVNKYFLLVLFTQCRWKFVFTQNEKFSNQINNVIFYGNAHNDRIRTNVKHEKSKR